MREIKFRAWDDESKKMIGPFEVGSELSMSWPPQMQYTGLLDRHGMKIFEGDIIRILLRRHMEDSVFANAEIAYEGAAFWFNAPKVGFTDCNWHFYNQSDREVIGNIYENPELLK